MLLLWWCPFEMKKGKWLTRQLKNSYWLVPLLTPVSCRWTVTLILYCRKVSCDIMYYSQNNSTFYMLGLFLLNSFCWICSYLNLTLQRPVLNVLHTKIEEFHYFWMLKCINVKTNIKMVLNESRGPLPLQIKCKSVKNVKLWKLKRMVYNGTTLVHKTFTEYYQFMKKTEFKNVMLMSL